TAMITGRVARAALGQGRAAGDVLTPRLLDREPGAVGGPPVFQPGGAPAEESGSDRHEGVGPDRSAGRQRDEHRYAAGKEDRPEQDESRDSQRALQVSHPTHSLASSVPES